MIHICNDAEGSYAADAAERSLPNPEYEATHAKLHAESRAGDGKPDGTWESIERCARMLDTYGPECFPANEKGQVHFARAMMESVADEIRALIAAQIPTDYMEMVTNEWLTSIGFTAFTPPSGFRNYRMPMPCDDEASLQLSYGEFEKAENWTVEVLGHNKEDGDFGALLIYQKDLTRGHVRQLLAVLGITP